MDDATATTAPTPTPTTPRSDAWRTAAVTVLAVIGVGVPALFLATTEVSPTGPGPDLSLATSNLAFLVVICLTAAGASLLPRDAKAVYAVALMGGAAAAAVLASVVTAATLPEYIDGVPVTAVGFLSIAALIAAVILAWRDTSSRQRIALVVVPGCIVALTLARMFM